MKLIPYAITLLLASLLACQKPIDAVKPVDTAHPSDTTKTTPAPTSHSGVVYDHGTPVGQLTQKVIGPEGGTLASMDGTLTMTIPAGAVSKATTFSIQPVTPTLPGLISGQSFRLLPEGQTFAQPVTLHYHYNADSLDGTSAQALFMAYQSSDGYWKALLNTELDETAQTLTVSTKHFSDWGAFAQYTLDATPDVVFPAQSAELALSGYWDEITPLTPEAVELELAKKKALRNPSNIKNWRYVGKGTLEVATDRTSATYWPSESVTKGTALIKVDVYNIIPPGQVPRKGATGKVELLKTIRIEGAYFRATVNGKSYEGKTWHAIVTAQETNIGGLLANGDYISFVIGQTELRPGKIAYAADDGADLSLTGNAIASLEIDGDLSRPYESWYSPCEGEHIIVSPGGITIDAVEVINGNTYVRGSYEATVYWEEGACPDQKLDTRSIRGEFRVVIKNK
ncbi:hypothetical protein GCM10028805_26290 [Spirosoma harenae]